MSCIANLIIYNINSQIGKKERLMEKKYFPIFVFFRKYL